jgi:ABC-type amino acid transport substrate-binding protein
MNDIKIIALVKRSLKTIFCNLLNSAKLVILLSLLMAKLAFAATPPDTIVLGITAPALQSSQVQLAKTIFSHIFKELDYELKVEVLPSIRLAKQTETGAIDGELVRMSDYGDTHPHLTRVDEPIFEFSVAAYSNDADLNIASWEDLKGLKVGYRRGVKVVENELIKVFNKDQLVQFTDIPYALKILSLNRLDAYIGVEFLTDELLIKQPENIVSNIFKISNLKKESAHLFLGNRISYLAPIVSSALKKMKLSGRYRTIIEQQNN